MQDSQKKQITDIVNAFRLINKDIRESFKIMCDELESRKDFEPWKKDERGVKKAKKDYWDPEGFFYGSDNWYYLNCYGMLNKKVLGFTFVISINYDNKEDIEYSDFINQLDNSINKNTPMLCVYGIYEPIDIKKIKLTDEAGFQYVDGILRFSGACEYKNYEKEKIKYDEWIDMEVDYQDGNKIKNDYDGWYKRAKVKIKHITNISSKEEAHRIIDELIKCKI